MASVKTIKKYMTPAPRTIGFDQSLETALEHMRELRVRHLPVLKAGKLIGVVSDRDINLVLTFAEERAVNLPVEEALTPDPYFTPQDASLAEVATKMAEKKYGCALVMDGNRVVGIFTAVDALKALSEVLSAADGKTRKTVPAGKATGKAVKSKRRAR